jgi:hypothetical protein
MTALSSAAIDLDATDPTNDFDLDIRIAVGADVGLPEAGFSCSWYTCSISCNCTSGCGDPPITKAPFC